MAAFRLTLPGRVRVLLGAGFLIVSRLFPSAGFGFLPRGSWVAAMTVLEPESLYTAG